MSNKNITTKLICSSSHNPWYNLAMEEHLLKQVKTNEIILYLWQNDNTIVVGRNQNPWKECRCKDFENNGGKIARRLSGGGTVFHDLGNLNFTFIMDKKLNNLNRQLKVILEAVNNLGVEANFSGRNDILVSGKKFSGNAFYEENASSYHHGTILVNSNIDNLITYLKVSKEKISSKGIDSVNSRVVNLKSIKNDITIENVKASIIKNFLKIYGGNPSIEYVNNSVYPLESLYSKYASWEWIYGETPKFDINFMNRFVWGEIDLNLKLDNGIIDSVVIYSDAMDSKLIKNIEMLLVKTPFKKESIFKNLNTICSDINTTNLIYDIKKWLETKVG
ncbi:lipoate--protein ligase [Clostridium ganghwense]|uniref:lipoate--protein ligase n=1 Tax=Clostridium ganghwense TaxID=312089 RepID=A0ABT4CL83_9CLOT|nr:lipoate--protein ligase [Clostridium ganghwense]MCY6369797.1 lipoate--protein ligase [Clostridium ganghwense]